MSTDSIQTDAVLAPAIKNDAPGVIAETGRKPPLTGEILVKIVGQYCSSFPEWDGANADAIKSQQKHLAVLIPRLICYHLLCHRMHLTLATIGKRIGDRDHTTVLSGIKCAARYIKRYPDLAVHIDVIWTLAIDRYSFKAGEPENRSYPERENSYLESIKWPQEWTDELITIVKAGSRTRIKDAAAILTEKFGRTFSKSNVGAKIWRLRRDGVLPVTPWVRVQKIPVPPITLGAKRDGA